MLPTKKKKKPNSWKYNAFIIVCFMPRRQKKKCLNVYLSFEWNFCLNIRTVSGRDVWPKLTVFTHHSIQKRYSFTWRWAGRKSVIVTMVTVKMLIIRLHLWLISLSQIWNYTWNKLAQRSMSCLWTHQFFFFLKMMKIFKVMF